MEYKNKIILGDCLDVMKDMPDNSVDVIFTSPPYNRKRNDTYEKFDDINEDYLSLLKEVTKESLRIAKKNVIINIQSNMYNKKDLIIWQTDFVDYFKGCVVWVKKNPTPSWNYKKERDVYSITNAYEYFYLFGKDNTNFEANNKIFNVLITEVNQEHFEGHGAVMRLDVAEWFICNFSKKKDLVFDPFIGCGTTAIACIRNQREWGGVEIVSEYKHQAEKRISDEENKNYLFSEKEIQTVFNPYRQFEL